MISLSHPHTKGDKDIFEEVMKPLRSLMSSTASQVPV